MGEQVLALEGKKLIYFCKTVFSLFFFFLLSSSMVVSAWQGELADGTLLTEDQLHKLLDDHKKWLQIFPDELNREQKERCKEKHKDECRKNILSSDWGVNQGRLVLKKADLRKANLEGVNLGEANLEETNLSEANLKSADLTEAYLEGVNLTEVDLRGARLWFANLEGADLTNARLHQVSLWSANLQSVNMFNANLEGAFLTETNVQGANLKKTNLLRVRYEPNLGSLPDIVSFISATNLETMWFDESPHAMQELRREFRRVGFLRQERAITYAIKKTEEENAIKQGDLIEPLFNRVFFNWTVGYGLYPNRALKILSYSILMFALPYWFAIMIASPNHTIYRVSSKERIEILEGLARLADTVDIKQLFNRPKPKDWCNIVKALKYAFLFSLISAFNIGWRELNVGTWIARLQPNASTLQANGWVRTVSGIQSLLSVYLLAMWILTDFGRLFE